MELVLVLGDLGEHIRPSPLAVASWRATGISADVDARILGATALVLISATACGDAARSPATDKPTVRLVRDHVPERALTVDTRAGSFRGLRLRNSEADVRARFGAAKCSDSSPAQPLGEDYYDIGGPTYFREPRGTGPGRACHMRYRQLVVFLFPGGVHGFMATDPRAQTEDGVGPGDPQALVPQRYPNARCETANKGTEYTTFPLCTVVLRPGRRLYFGADPIRSVWLIATTRRGLR